MPISAFETGIGGLGSDRGGTLWKPGEQQDPHTGGSAAFLAVLGEWRTLVVQQLMGKGPGSTDNQVPLLPQTASDNDRKVGPRFPQAEPNICQALGL